MISLPEIGKGLYTPTEACLYAKLDRSTGCRWLFGDSSSKSVLDPQLKELDGEQIVTFRDYIQMLAIRTIRTTRKISLQKIRKVIAFAEEKFDVKYPFARKHTTFLHGDDLVIKLDDEYIVASGQTTGNILINEVAELYLDDVGYDSEGYISSYIPYRRGGAEVLMDPRVRFGAPVLSTCRYSVSTLWDAYIAEGGIKQAAETYGVSENDVKTAIAYTTDLNSFKREE